MIIWINGPFGIGKTQTAFELKRRINNSVVFDPERIGFFIQSKIPKALKLPDFQSYKIWRDTTRSFLDYIDTNDKQTIIVPMTLVVSDYYDEIILPLCKTHIVRHFSLIASKKTIECRLIRRGDRNTWNYKQIDRCLSGLNNRRFQEYIDTDRLDLNQVVEYIGNRIG